MLSYIQKQIRQRMPEEPVKKTNDNIPDDVMMECAHLIQELDDLSVEGTDAEMDRPLGSALDIPLEDDIDVESLDIDSIDDDTDSDDEDGETLSSINSMHNINEKTEKDFYDEACKVIKPFVRDSESSIEARRQQYVKTKMKEYQEWCIQEGLFGNDKVSVDDSMVPNTATCNFGPLKGKGSPDYFVKLQIYWEVDNRSRVTRKQVESIHAINDTEGFKTLKDAIHEHYKSNSKYRLKSADEIWDHATPKSIRVPILPADKFFVSVVIETDWDDDAVFSWSMPTTKKNRVGNLVCEETFKKTSSAFKTKKEIIKEYEDMMELERRKKTRPYPSRFVQEAIDFGGSSPDMGPQPPAGAYTGDTDTSVSMDPPDPNTQQNPPSDANNQQPDIQAPPSDTNDQSSSNDTVDVPVQTNDVSDQIADKVAQGVEQQNDTPTEDISDISSIEEPSADLTSTPPEDQSLDDAVSDAVGDINVPGEDTDTKSINSADFDNMSVEELISSGSDKLKTLSLGQLKDFLSGKTDDPAVQEAYQEFFFATKNNVKKKFSKELTVLANDMQSIVGAKKGNKLTRGKILKMYKPTEHSYDVESNSGSDGGINTTSHKTTKISSPEMDHITKVSKSIDKINKHNKLYDVFSSDEKESLKGLKTTIKEFIGDIEALIEDSSGTEKLINEIGKEANDIYVFCHKLMGNNQTIQEAFFLTKRNINKELDINLRKVLGILNDAQTGAVEILNKFKKQSKSLNKILIKAAKMNAVYNQEEMMAFTKLNKCLCDLNIMIGTENTNGNYAAIIKRLIQAFVSQAAVVAKIIENHDTNKKNDKNPSNKITDNNEGNK